MQSSREVKGRQEVDKQTPQNRPIYQQSRRVLVSSRAEIKSGPNMKIPNGLISHLNQSTRLMFTCLDNDGKARRDDDGVTETVTRDDLIKDDKSPDQDQDKAVISVSESPCHLSVSVKSNGGDGKCRQLPTAGNDGKYRIEATAGSDGKDGMSRDIDGKGASIENIRRLERSPPVKYRDVSPILSDTTKMSSKEVDREQEMKIQQEIRNWIRNMSESWYENLNKKGLKMRSSLPLRIGSKSLDFHKMFETGFEYSGDQDDKRRPHGQGATTGSYKVCIRPCIAGSVRWRNGDSFCGQFRDGLRHGPGLLRLVTSQLMVARLVRGEVNMMEVTSLEGDWVVDILEGPGTVSI